MADVETAPMILAEALAYLKPDPANNGTISLRAPKAREAVEVVEAAIAAHRSKDREDGAREMRERAAEAARRSQPVPADRERYALNEAARAIRALPLTTRTEDGDA